MSRRTRLIVSAAALAVVVLLMWVLRPPSRAEQAGRSMADPDQQRLWREVEDRGAPRALDRLAPAPLSAQPAPGAPAAPQAAAPDASLAPGVVNGIRLVSTTERGDWEHSGTALVVDASGERIDLDLGGPRRLAVAARMQGKPLAIAAGERVELRVQMRTGFFNRREILAMRTMRGAELMAALETGPTPVTLTVSLPPSTFVARQIGTPLNGTMPVVVDSGAAKEPLPRASTVMVDGLSVRLLGSVARPGAPGADASPYAIDLVAWRPGK